MTRLLEDIVESATDSLQSALDEGLSEYEIEQRISEITDMETPTYCAIKIVLENPHLWNETTECIAGDGTITPANVCIAVIYEHIYQKLREFYSNYTPADNDEIG